MATILIDPPTHCTTVTHTAACQCGSRVYEWHRVEGRLVTCISCNRQTFPDEYGEAICPSCGTE